jgi:hypothetical protein
MVDHKLCDLLATAGEFQPELLVKGDRQAWKIDCRSRPAGSGIREFDDEIERTLEAGTIHHARP